VGGATRRAPHPTLPPARLNPLNRHFRAWLQPAPYELQAVVASVFVEVKQRLKSTRDSTGLNQSSAGESLQPLPLREPRRFTQQARYEAVRAAVPLTLVDLLAPYERLLVHHDGLNAEPSSCPWPESIGRST
jgi:hypothetical protein